MGSARMDAFLRERGVTPAIRQFADTHSADLAAQALGVHVAQISKSLVVVAGGKPHLMMLPGDRKADWGKVKALLGARGRMATPDEVLAHTGYPVGAVSPFGLPAPLPVYLDRALERFETVWMSGGTADTLLALSWSDVCNLTGGTIAEFAVPK